MANVKVLNRDGVNTNAAWQAMVRKVADIGSAYILTAQKPVAYFVDKTNNNRLSLSLNPDEFDENFEGTFQEYDVIKRGQVIIPGGCQADTYSWNGILLGESRKNLTFIHRELWHEPQGMVKQFRQWVRENTPMQVVVTGTNINADVYIKSFKATPYGGHGDYKYDIELIEITPITIRSMDEEKTIENKVPADNLLHPRQDAARQMGLGYVEVTMKEGQDLYDVARLTTGDGKNAKSIADFNNIIDPRAIGEGYKLSVNLKN